jgi:hypothetical protein
MLWPNAALSALAEPAKDIDQTSLAPNSLKARHAISDRISNPRPKLGRKIERG